MYYYVGTSKPQKHSIRHPNWIIRHRFIFKHFYVKIIDVNKLSSYIPTYVLYKHINIFIEKIKNREKYSF